MNAFVRQIAALSVLWSLCELLLPEGGSRRAVRMTVSLLMIAALMNGLNGLIGGAVPLLPSRDVWAQSASDGGYGHIALRSAANQAQRYCERMGERAGYQARAAVYLCVDGSLERVELWLNRREGAEPLADEEALAARVAQALLVDASRVRLMGAGGS